MDHDVYADQSSDQKSIRDQFWEAREEHPLRMSRKRYSRTNRTVLSSVSGFTFAGYAAQKAPLP